MIIREIRMGIFLSGVPSVKDISSARSSITGVSREILDSLYG
jgi:hypothetical protein